MLEFAEQGNGSFELTGEALGVDAEVSELFRVPLEVQAHGYCAAGGAGRAKGDVREDIGFKRGGAVESPGGVGQCLDEMDFGGALGMVFAGERGDVAVVGFQVLGVHDDHLAGESVANGVEGGDLLALGGFGSGGVFGIGAVDGGAVGCRSHLWILFRLSDRMGVGGEWVSGSGRWLKRGELGVGIFGH